MKCAVILSGCGFLDGAEIRESVLSLLALDQQGFEYEIFSPDDDQFHVVNHKLQEPNEEKRNILEESARIARGQISPLTDLNAENFQALLIPGGFGVAKNLCNFAFEGPNGVVREDVSKVLNDFKNAKKPIGAVCIAPALLALQFKGLGLKLTIGTDEGTASVIESLGHTHFSSQTHEFVSDPDHLVVTTPAYMFDDGSLKDISTGISGAVKQLKNWCS